MALQKDDQLIKLDWPVVQLPIFLQHKRLPLPWPRDMLHEYAIVTAKHFTPIIKEQNNHNLNCVHIKTLKNIGFDHHVIERKYFWLCCIFDSYNLFYFLSNLIVQQSPLQYAKSIVQFKLNTYHLPFFFIYTSNFGKLVNRYQKSKHNGILYIYFEQIPPEAKTFTSLKICFQAVLKLSLL